MAEKATITMAERNKIIMDLRAQFTEKFIKEVKEQHPDWSDTKIRGVAENMAQKEVSKNTQWDVDVVGKTPPTRPLKKIGLNMTVPGKEKVVYKAGKGEEVMVKPAKTSQIEPSTGNKINDIISTSSKRRNKSIRNTQFFLFNFLLNLS